MTMDVVGLIIHLERATKRETNVIRLESELRLNTRRIAAVDGCLLVSNARAHYSDVPLHRPVYPFKITNAEIACALSHRRAWQTLVDGSTDAALIVEDDVKILPHFHECFEFALRNLYRSGLIQFRVQPPKCGTALSSEHGIELREAVPALLGTQCQLVHREAAIRLLRSTENFDRPIDAILQLHWVTGVKPLALYPSGVLEASRELGGSTISQKKSLLTKTYHEIARPIYRAKIALAAQRAS